MKLPSRMLDLSVPLDNETVLDPPNMRPRIDYKTNKENAWMLLESFPGRRAEDLPDGEGWAFELVQFTTHNGTHMDAPARGPALADAAVYRCSAGCRDDPTCTRWKGAIWDYHADASDAGRGRTRLGPIWETTASRKSTDARWR
jgi:hypothetical protein